MIFLNRLLGTPILAFTAALIFCTYAALPVRADEPPGEIAQISVGERHACAITQGRALYCWGDNRFGQIGDGTKGDGQSKALANKRNPTQIFASGATAVSAGYAHTCAVVNGALHCWGWNQSGQVNGKPGDKPILKPALVLPQGASAVAAGGMHTCAVVRGSALCWGGDTSAIGIASYASDTEFKPKQMVASGVTAIAARTQSTCAIVKGALQCWGDNSYSQISSARSNGYQRPTELIASGVTAVSIGGNDGAICAVVGGALQCWGKKYDPAAGPNGISAVPKPTTVIAQGVTDVSLSGLSGCAVVQGALQCWGYDSMGNLGLGGNAPRVIPNPAVVIAGGVSAVGVGEGYTCALVGGALRCRGYNGYGAISVTHSLDSTYDSRAFNIAQGDVRVLSPAKADAVTAMEQLPEKIARFLEGKLIAHDEAVYFVRRADSGYLSNDVRKGIAFALDVTPVYPMALGSGATDRVIAPDTPCGGTNLLPRVGEAEFSVQKDHEFVPMAQLFSATFPGLPRWNTRNDRIPLRLSPGDMQKITSCAKAIHEAWDKEPIQSIALGGVNIAPSLSRSWSVPGEGEHGAGLALNVPLKPGRKADLSVQAQSVSTMMCNGVALQGWKRGLSSPWKLRGQVFDELAAGYFDADEDSVQAVDTPAFPAYTQAELRRAIHAEQGREGLAPVEAANTCAPAIMGYQYTLHDGTRTVQTIYNPGFAAVPERGCDQPLPTLALRAADQLGILRGKQLHSARCKAWPGDATRTLVALVREQDGNTPDMGSYDLDLLVVKTASAEILQHMAQPGAITSDAMHFDGIALDTANYTLAPGQRAFGLRTQHSHMGGTSAHEESLRLYMPQGKALSPVLPEMNTSFSAYEGGSGGDCNETRDTKRSVAIGKPGKHGFADLVVTEQRTEQEVKTNQKDCTEVTHKSTRRFVLPFDGGQYVIPPGLNQ